MTVRQMIFTVVGCAMQPTILIAQSDEMKHGALASDRLSLGLEYTTEMQTDFRKANWVNHLQLSADLHLVGPLSLQAKTISVAKTRGDRLIDDLQVYSNIEEDNLTLAPSMLGLQWVLERTGTELFVGVRNVGVDYFTTPYTSLFTTSSAGIFPTISANYDIANYPLASMGIDIKQTWRQWLFEASLYNGQGYNRWTGRDNAFRFCPKSDGIFFITAATYEHNNSNYTLGCAVHHGQRSDDETRDAPLPAASSKKTGCAPWVNVEQQIAPGWHLLGQASVNFGAFSECKHYEAIGVVAELGNFTYGAIINHAKFDTAHETDLEITVSVPLMRNAYLQPACHIIRTDHHANCVALLRFGIAI